MWYFLSTCFFYRVHDSFSFILLLTLHSFPVLGSPLLSTIPLQVLWVPCLSSGFFTRDLLEQGHVYLDHSSYDTYLIKHSSQ